MSDTFHEFPKKTVAKGYAASSMQVGKLHRVGFYAHGALQMTKDYPAKPEADKAMKEWRKG